MENDNPYALELVRKMGLPDDLSGRHKVYDTVSMAALIARLPKMRIVMNTDGHNYTTPDFAYLAWDIDGEYPQIGSDYEAQMGADEENPLEPIQRADGSWYVIGNTDFKDSVPIDLVLYISGS